MNVFLHGVPGSPRDAALLTDASNVMAPNLLALASAAEDALDGPGAWFDQQDFRDVTLIAFSLGARIGCHIAATRPGRVRRLILVSPAAPLTLGNYLPDMAGRAVFQLASRRPGMLRALTHGQGLWTRAAPDALLRQLFKGTDPTEQALSRSQTARPVLHAALHNAYVAHRSGYIALLEAYLTDWRAELSAISCPVEIWHGSADTWAPPAMARDLSGFLGDRAVLHMQQGVGHYTTLQKVRLPAI